MIKANSEQQPILLTGSHRSGTTWVGKVLRSAPKAGYLHEPLNLRHSRGMWGVVPKYWFTHINPTNEEIYRDHFEKLLSFRFDWFPKQRSRNNLKVKELGRVLNDLRLLWQYRLTSRRPLIKDPIAIMSTEWLAKEFDCRVIVLIRHPAAFVSSLVRLGWDFPFNHFMDQPQLMSTLLQPYHNRIQEFARKEQPLIDQAILLWNCIHSIIRRYQEQHPSWYFARHEDLSRDPSCEFQEMFQYAGFKFTNSTKTLIQELSAEQNPVDVEKTHVLSRDSKKNIWVWKERLSQQEIRKIKEETRRVWQCFYSEEDW